MTKAPDWRVAGEEHGEIHVYDNESGLAVVSRRSRPTEEEMVRLALCVQMCSGLTNEQMKASIELRGEGVI